MSKLSIIDDLNTSRKNDIVRDNEISANKFLWFCMFLFLAINIAVFILCLTDSYKTPNDNGILSCSCVNIAVLVITLVVCKGLKFDRWWIRYLLVGSSIVTFSILNLVLTFYYSMGLVCTIPIILSIRYYDHKFTIKMIIVDFLLFTLTNLLGAYFVIGIIDFDYCVFIPGTVIKDDTTIDYMIAHIDRLATLINCVILAVIPMFILSVFFGIFSTMISKSNNQMLETNYRYVKEIVSAEEELSIAGKIQQNMLPKRFDKLNQNEHFKILASISPAKQTGGDFYDIFKLSDDKLVFLVADVSGKGVPAALFMVKSKTIIKDAILANNSLKVALKNVQTALYDDDSDLFVTLWVGILDLNTGLLTYVNAGHNFPVMIPKKEEAYLLKNKPQKFLSPFATENYKEEKLSLTKGDRIFVYTDGVTEAINTTKEMFGTNRLIGTLEESRNRDISSCLQGVNNAIKGFCGEEEQFDDTTLLMLEYKG